MRRRRHAWPLIAGALLAVSLWVAWCAAACGASGHDHRTPATAPPRCRGPGVWFGVPFGGGGEPIGALIAGIVIAGGIAAAAASASVPCGATYRHAPPEHPDCPLAWDEDLARCRRIEPSNFDVAVFRDVVARPLLVDDGEVAVVDSDTGEIVAPVTGRPAGSPGEALDGIWFDVIAPAEGPQLAVFGVQRLVILAGGRLEIRGSRPVAIYVAGDVTLFGTLAAWAAGESSESGGIAGGALQIAADGRISVFASGGIEVGAPPPGQDEPAGVSVLLEAAVVWNGGTIRAGRGEAPDGGRIRINFQQSATEGSCQPPPELHRGVETW